MKGASNRPLKPFGHAQRKAGALPAEPPRKAGRLLRPFGHRRRSGASDAPVRSSFEDGLELYKPFIMKKLVEDGVVYNIKKAKSLVEEETDAVWAILDEVVKEHPVLLNRAPTLHRLGIQAFDPVLVDGRRSSFTPSCATPTTPTLTVTRWRSTCRSSMPPRWRAGR